MIWIKVIWELFRLFITFIAFIIIGFFTLIGMLVWFLFKCLYNAIRFKKKGGVKKWKKK